MAEDGTSPYLFLQTPFGSPIAELRATFEKKRQMHESLGEIVAALDLESAYREARKALAAALVSPACAERAVTGVLRVAEAGAPVSASSPTGEVPGNEADLATPAPLPVIEPVAAASAEELPRDAARD